MRLLLFLLVSVLFASCNVYYHGTHDWVFGDWLWTIPTGLFSISIIMGIKTWAEWHSGSWHQDKSPTSPTFGKMIDDKGNYRAFNWPPFVTIICLVAAIVFIIIQIGQR